MIWDQVRIRGDRPRVSVKVVKSASGSLRLEVLVRRLLGNGDGRGSKFKFTSSFLPVRVWARGRARACACSKQKMAAEGANRDRLETDRQANRQTDRL